MRTHTEHLTDDYTRRRVKHFNTHGKEGGKLSESDWSSPKVHKHFKQLENVKVSMQTSDDVNTINVIVAYNELASAYVHYMSIILWSSTLLSVHILHFYCFSFLLRKYSENHIISFSNFQRGQELFCADYAQIDVYSDVSHQWLSRYDSPIYGARYRMDR